MSLKYYSTKFEDYIYNCNKLNIHNNMEDFFEHLPKKINDQNHMIFYGPPGTGKYTQVLQYIKKFSPTNLRFERKINIVSNKKEYIFKISDIHFEIDMSLLGCHAKVLFNDIYYNILDILAARPNSSGIILCKNFHTIHSELLDIFYSYMQNLQHKHLHLNYIILTENISFIPNNIINRCLIVPFKRPTKTIYQKIIKKRIITFDIKEITNIKNLKSGIDELKNINSKICDQILNKIKNYKDIHFLNLRDIIYSIFIYNLNVYDCLFYIIDDLISNNLIPQDRMESILIKLHNFLKLYNNNYRPIYHLENFILYLCINIHELSESM
jgi:hypothetical protein